MNYLVLPTETEDRVVCLTEKERNQVQGLSFWQGIVLWVLIAFVALLVVATLVAALFDALGFITTDVRTTFVFIGVAIVAIAATSVAVALIASSSKKMEILKLEGKITLDAKKEYQGKVREAEALTSILSRLHESSTKLATELHQHLNQASRRIQDAENEYHANAFAPFWDAVENAVQHLSAFNDKSNRLSELLTSITLS